MARAIHWTSEIFTERARLIHGDRYDYSNVTNDNLTCSKSMVPITCNTCNYEWSPTVRSHLQGTGCPSCTGQQWSLPKFLDKAHTIHNDRYDYLSIQDEEIISSESKIPITCNTCSNQCFVSVTSHINHKTGCPYCARR